MMALGDGTNSLLNWTLFSGSCVVCSSRSGSGDSSSSSLVSIRGPFAMPTILDTQPIKFANHKSLKTLVLALLLTLSLFIFIIAACVVLLVIHQKGYLTIGNGRDATRLQLERQEEMMHDTLDPRNSHHASSSAVIEDEVDAFPEITLQMLLRQVARGFVGSGAMRERYNSEIERMILMSLSPEEQFFVDSMSSADRSEWVRGWRRRLIREERDQVHDSVNAVLTRSSLILAEPSSPSTVSGNIVDGFVMVPEGAIENFAVSTLDADDRSPTTLSQELSQVASAPASQTPSLHSVHSSAPRYNVLFENYRSLSELGNARNSIHHESAVDSRETTASLANEEVPISRSGDGIVLVDGYGAFMEVHATDANGERIKLYQRASSEFVYGTAGSYLRNIHGEAMEAIDSLELQQTGSNGSEDTSGKRRDYYQFGDGLLAGIHSSIPLKNNDLANVRHTSGDVRGENSEVVASRSSSLDEPHQRE